MSSSRFVWLSLAVLFLCTTVSGCGGAPAYEGATRYAVTGNVTFDGEPINGGMISFIPENDKLNPSGGPIENGAYSIPAEKGPNEGTYRVAIYWHKPTGEQIKDSDTGEMIDAVKQVVPARFNDGTELQATITADAAAAGMNYDVTSK
ncbi:MAG: hypothetical protein R3C59_20330 [Planctomycetaceae bacterium]